MLMQNYGFKKVIRAMERDGLCMKYQMELWRFKPLAVNQVCSYPMPLIKYGFNMEIKARASTGVLNSLGKTIFSRLKEEKQEWFFLMLVIKSGFKTDTKGKESSLK